MSRLCGKASDREFLNRVDDIVIFKPLAKDEVRKIVLLLIDELRQRIADQRLTLELTDAACDYIADTAYDPVFGARPLKRFIQRELETRVGRALIAGDVVADGKIIVDVGDAGLKVDIVSKG